MFTVFCYPVNIRCSMFLKALLTCVMCWSVRMTGSELNVLCLNGTHLSVIPCVKM